MTRRSLPVTSKAAKAALIVLVGTSASIVSSFGTTAHAQAFSRLEPGQQTLTVEAGLQAAVVTSVGYAAGVRVPAIDRTVMPFLQGSLPVARPDLGDYAARAGAQVSLLDLGWLDISTQLAFEVEGTENSLYRATALRTDLVLLAGHYGRHWFAAAEGGYDHSWLTYIKNSDWYRSYFYAGAKDGWYGNSAGTVHAGLKGGLTLGSVELIARAGLAKTERLNDLDVPFYAMLGAGYRF